MQMHCMYTLDDSGFLKNFLYQGGLKSTVSCVFVFVSCLSLAEQIQENTNFGPNLLKGAMDKKAGGVIWLPFLQFLSNCNETLSISFFFRGRLNPALRSDLTPLHSAHFTTAQRGLCTDFQTFLSR